MLLRDELELCRAVLCAHAEIRKAHPEQRVLALFDGVQLFHGDDLTGGNARGEAGIGGLVPGEEPGLSGKSPDFRLGDAADAKGGQDARLFQRLKAGAVGNVVAEVRAVDDQLEAVRFRGSLYS